MNESNSLVEITIGNVSYRCIPDWGCYANGRFALMFYDATTGEAIHKASVNLVDHPLEPYEMVLNNDYDIEPDLVRAGIAAPSHRKIVEVRPWGNIEWNVCRLIDPPQIPGHLEA
jgi:hypothetical protein